MNEELWIEWEGGECPVEGGADVEVVDGGGLIGQGPAGEFNWEWTPEWPELNIIAYRLVQP